MYSAKRNRLQEIYLEDDLPESFADIDNQQIIDNAMKRAQKRLGKEIRRKAPKELRSYDEHQKPSKKSRFTEIPEKSCC